MKKHNAMKETRVVPRAVVPHVNGEAAHGGEAVEAVNVREHEASLQVTGQPAVAGMIGNGERLLLIEGSHQVTVSGSTVLIDGDIVATVAGTIVGAHAIGSLIVIVTSEGFIYLSPSGGTWSVLDPADAVPQLSIGVEISTVSADLDAYTFAAPYSHWAAPLASADTSALARMLRTAWSALHSDALAEGYHTAPMLVRWAVRLLDGTYLWMSDPMRVGDATLANADRVSANVTTTSNSFTGIEATTMAFKRYSLTLDVTRDIGAAWLPLVAGIDLLATDEAELLTASRSLDYRCITRTQGGREYILEMGLSRRNAAAITYQLTTSSWHLIASAPAAPHIQGSDFVAPDRELTLTPAQCAAVGTSMHVDGVVCSTTAGGRLYCCTPGGDVIVSAPGNALVEAHRRTVLGTTPLAITVMPRPLYSNGLGRYPVYVFTDDGIYAIPQDPSGTLGEARLVDRTVIAPDVAPVEGGRAIWFVSRHRHLCRLNATRVEVWQHDVDYRALAWCNAYSELWALPQSGNPVAMMTSGAWSERTVDVAQLYCDALHAVAVSDDGTLLDLERETPATMPVKWCTHPVAIHALLCRAVQRVVWHVKSEGAALELCVTAQRGIMVQNCTVSRIVVDGVIEQPLATAPMTIGARTLRLSLEGTASAGTLLLPTLIYHS